MTLKYFCYAVTFTEYGYKQLLLGPCAPSLTERYTEGNIRKWERTVFPKTKYRNDNPLDRYRAFFCPRISTAKRVASSGAVTLVIRSTASNPAIKKPCIIRAYTLCIQGCTECMRKFRIKLDIL